MYGKKLQGIQKIISEFVTQIKFTKKCDDQIGVPWIQKCLKTIIKNTHPSLKKKSQWKGRKYTKHKTFTCVLALKGSEKTILT